MIKILIVDDSKTETLLLKNLLEAEKDMEVIGCAKNGEEAVKLAELLKPDLITMDILMPIMDGVEATRLIMMQHPIPIVVISSTVDNKSLKTTFQALEAGALSVLAKPLDVAKSSNETGQHIIQTVRSMAEIKVIRRRFNTRHLAKKNIQQKPETKPIAEYHRDYEILAIGASVGGPQALKNILSKLPTNFPIPIVIVQHMTQGFIKGFTEWLNTNTSLKIKNAENNELLLNGTVYFAPDNHHLEVRRRAEHLIAKLSKNPPVSGFCPSITVLLQSIAKTCGKNAIGVILTGMGNDGAQGLLELKKAHAHTLIQDPESAVVFGMAGVAQSLGAVDKVIELDQMADYLVKVIKQ